jgi:hypothetical protein
MKSRSFREQRGYSARGTLIKHSAMKSFHYFLQNTTLTTALGLMMSALSAQATPIPITKKVPLSAQLGQSKPSSYVKVGNVQLPQLSHAQWKMLGQMQGADRKPLRLDVTLSVYRGQVYGVSVLRGTGYPDVDATVVKWIQSNWKTAPWFGVGTQSAVSFDIDPSLRQVRFETRAGFVRFAIDFDCLRPV